MADLEREIRAPEGFVSASTGPEGGSNVGIKGVPPVQNPDALDVDLDDG